MRKASAESFLSFRPKKALRTFSAAACSALFFDGPFDRARTLSPRRISTAKVRSWARPF